MNDQQTARDPYLQMLNIMRDEAEGLMPLWYCIGTVLSVGEKSITVQALGHELTEEDLKINDALRATWMEDEEMDVDMGEPEMAGTLHGYAGCPNGSHSSFSVNSFSGELKKEKARLKVPWKLAAGDEVLLIPNGNRQFFYLVMKVVAYGTIPPDRAAGAAQ